MPDGVWMSVSELAIERGCTKQSLSERVNRLESAGQLKTKRGPNRSRLVNVAEFLRAVDQATDLVRETNGAGAAAARLNEPSEAPADDRGAYSREQARNTSIRADLAQLELDQRLGKLLRIEDVEAAMTRCAESLVRTIEQMVGGAEDLAAAVGRDGVNGARQFIRDVGRKLRQRLSDEMRVLADACDEPTANE